MFGEPSGPLAADSSAVRLTGDQLHPAVYAFGKILRSDCEDSGNLPVFVRYKGLDLALALDDKPDCHALHASGAELGSDLAPEQRADFVPDDAIQNSPRLLRVHFVFIDLMGIPKRLLDSRLGDLVEDHARGLFVRN